jgi:soluble lytic murein transglycosylase-like protein
LLKRDTMEQKTILSTAVLLLLTVASTAQIRRDANAPLLDKERELEPLIVASAQRYGINPRVLAMVCFVESRFRVDAVSPKGARGLMQFMPETAARYGLANPNDPRAAIDAAARYLRDLLGRYGGRVDLALAAYNAGEGTVDSFRTGRPLVLPTGKIINPRGVVTGGIPPYPETQAYVNQILGLLVRPHSRATPPAASTNERKTTPQIKQRDFTLDALINDMQSTLKKRSTANTFFIDIQ